MTFSPLLGPNIYKQSAASFKAYVRSLFIKPISKTQTGVDGIRISFGKRMIIYVERDPKFVTYNEISTLAKEGQLNTDEMYRMFKKRKIEIRRDAWLTNR